MICSAYVVRRHFRLVLGCLIFGVALARAGNRSKVVMDRGIPKLCVNGRPVNNMFGVYVYCTDLDPSERLFVDEMKVTIDRISSAGIPVMSFDIRWSDYDRSTTVPDSEAEAASRFPTAALTEILDYAASRGVFVVMQVLVHDYWGLPLWWKQFPGNEGGYQMVNAGDADAERYNRYQTPVAAYGNPTHRRLLQALITRLIGMYRDHPAVIGWGIGLGPSGENGYTPNYIDAKFNRNLARIDLGTKMGDYSVTARRGFAAWLGRRYGGVAAVNAAWGTAYASLNAVVPPTPIRLSVRETFEKNGDCRPAMVDWQRFRYAALVEEWAFLSNFVRQLDDSKVVMGKTSWGPMGLATGTRDMVATSVAVNEQRLIDMDKVDAGITSWDYHPRFYFASRIDFSHLIQFSRKHGVIRVCNLENWCDREGHALPRVPLPRAMAMRDAIRAQGGYLWFVVATDSDRAGKPAWDWDDVLALVRRSTTQELAGISPPSASIAFHYDVEGHLPHYSEPQEGLRAADLLHAVAVSLFDGGRQPGYGVVSTADIEQGLLDASRTRLLILAEQRVMSSAMTRAIRSFVDASGHVLLIGSCGLFDPMATQNASAIRGLAPALTDEQVRHLYGWAYMEPVSVPLVVLSSSGARYQALPLRGDAAENYGLMAGLMPADVGFAKSGRLSLVRGDRGGARSGGERAADEHGGRGGPDASSREPPPRGGGGKDLIGDFDHNGDGVVTPGEFPGPADVFGKFDTNGDQKIDRTEAQQSVP